MISAKRVMNITLNRDRKERERLVDKLSEEDAKYMLKMALRTMLGESDQETKTGEEVS